MLWLVLLASCVPRVPLAGDRGDWEPIPVGKPAGVPALLSLDLSAGSDPWRVSLRDPIDGVSREVLLIEGLPGCRVQEDTRRGRVPVDETTLSAGWSLACAADYEGLVSALRDWTLPGNGYYVLEGTGHAVALHVGENLDAPADAQDAGSWVHVYVEAAVEVQVPVTRGPSALQLASDAQGLVIGESGAPLAALELPGVKVLRAEVHPFHGRPEVHLALGASADGCAPLQTALQERCLRQDCPGPSPAADRLFWPVQTGTLVLELGPQDFGGCVHGVYLPPAEPLWLEGILLGESAI